MAHKFDLANLHKLDNPKRREMLPPDKTLVTLGLKKGMKIVDVGCGSGYFALVAAEIVGNDGFVYGTDLHQELVDLCKQRAQDAGLTNTEFLKGQETVVPIKEQVDRAMMANVVHELIEPEKSFREISRILKAQGEFLIIDWKKEEMESGPPLHERLSVSQVEQLLKQGGFSIKETFDLGPTHYGIAAVKDIVKGVG